jgi:hypothetical protein
VGTGVFDGRNVSVGKGDGVIDTVDVDITTGAAVGAMEQATKKQSSKHRRTILIYIFMSLFKPPNG